MSVWAGDVADLVKPLYQVMIDRVLASHVIGTDDTIMPMLAPEKTRPARMWIYLGDDDHPYNLFDFTLSRSRDGPARFLKGYNQVLLADAYGGYEGICVEKEIIQAGCRILIGTKIDAVARMIRPRMIDLVAAAPT